MQICQLTPESLADLGRPTGAYLNAQAGLVAVASDFQAPFWAGRADLNFLHRCHRVSLYRSDWSCRLGVLDRLRFPINDLAFHPQRSICAIATGCYDGGYMFEGELWIWDWESDRAWSVLAESREVSSLRFAADGSLHLSLRPRDEEEFPAAPFETQLLGTLQDWRDYRELGLKWCEEPRLEGFQPVLQAPAPAVAWRELLPAHFQPRYRVMDVAWHGSDVLATQATCPLESWGARSFQCHPEGQGVQILSHPQGPLLHLMRDRCSHLLALQGGQLQPWKDFRSGYLFSLDRQGRILARHTEPDGSDDFVLAPESLALQGSGHFDCFNHALRLDGGEQPYLLRGTPPSSHQRKVLCRMDEQGHWQECFAWDRGPAHLMEGRASFQGDGSLLRAYKIYSPKIQESGTLDCLHMPEGQQRWQREVTSPVTCLAGNFYGLADGRLGCLNPVNGAVLWEHTLNLDGVTSIPLCLHLQGQQLACGTHDGRVLHLLP